MKLFQKRSALENLPGGGYSKFQVTGKMEGSFWFFDSGQVFFRGGLIVFCFFLGGGGGGGVFKTI